MRILQVHTKYRQPGGEDAVVEDEMGLLERGGHSVRQLLYSNPTGPVRSAALLMISPWNNAGKQRLLGVQEEFRPDIVHFHNTWFNPGPAVLRAVREGGASQVMTLHNYRLLCVNAMLYRDGGPCTSCVGSSSWPGVVHSCYRSSFASSAVAASTNSIHRRLGTWTDSVHRFIALTDFAKKMYVAGGLPADRISVRPNFVGDPGGRLQPPSESEIVLFAGRLSEEKGLATVLEAWRGESPSGLRLVVAGDGPERARWESLAPAGVEFHGRLAFQDLSELMHRSRALVMPSQWFEGQPRVLLEAMAHALPVAVSRIGGLADTVGEGQRELQAAPGDVADWSGVLRRLEDAQLVDRLSTDARDRYETHFTPQQALVTLERIYREAQRVQVMT